MQKWALTASVMLGAASLFSVGARAAGSGPGAEALEEVVVTAERREESAQRTSIAIATVSGEDIARSGDTNVQQILKNVTGVVVVGSARGQTVSIRGLGFDLPPQIGENSVSMNFDGTYNFRSEAGTYGFYDLARVEVLRGPQGTLYGRNATGGVVNVISNDPGREFGVQGTLELGSYALKRIEGAVNVPLSDDWATRVAVVHIDRNGYSNNGSNDAVGSAIRGKLRYQPSEDLRLQFNVEASKLGGKGPSFSSGADYAAGNPYFTTDPPTVSNYYQAAHYWAQLDVSAGPGRVTFIPSYQRAVGYNYAPPPGPPCNCVVRSNDPQLAKATSGELRYASRADSKVTWVAGAYYYDQSDASQAFGGNVTTSTRNTALFAQLTWPFTDAVRGIVGARESWDRKEFEGGGGSFASGLQASNSASAFDWKLGLEYDLAAQSLLYFTAASGHRPGGFNALAAFAPLVTLGSFYQAESLVSFELGSKNRFLDDRLEVNGDVFYYSYKDFQAPDIYPCLDPTCPPGLTAEFLSVPKVKDYGAELDLKAKLTQTTTVSLGATYLKATFDSTLVNTQLGVPILEAGDEITHAPKYALKGGIEQEFVLGSAGTLTARLEGRYTDKQFVNIGKLDPDNLQPAYSTSDFSLAYGTPDGRWNVQAYVKNLGDKVVKTASFGPPMPNVGSYALSDPRTYGVSLSAKL